MKNSSVVICLPYSTRTDELDSSELREPYSYIRSLAVSNPFCPHYLVFSALICLLINSGRLTNNNSSSKVVVMLVVQEVHQDNQAACHPPSLLKVRIIHQR